MKKNRKPYSCIDEKTNAYYGIRLIKGNLAVDNTIYMEYRRGDYRLCGVLKGEAKSGSEGNSNGNKKIVDACMDYLEVLDRNNVLKNIYLTVFRHIRYNKQDIYQELAKRCKQKIKEMKEQESKGQKSKKSERDKEQEEPEEPCM